MSEILFVGDEKMIFRSSKLFPPLQKQTTVKLGCKERLNKEQLGNSELFPMTNIPVHLSNK